MMKSRLVFGFSLLMVAAVGFFGFVTQAEKPSFEDQFVNGETMVAASSGSYSFDKAHSAIGFKVKHMGLVDVPGFFTDFTGTVNYDEKDVSKSSVEFTAKTASVDTRVEGRDRHLRSKDFFEVEKFPELTFKSTAVKKKGDYLHVTGDFTMRGTTKKITIPIKVVGFKSGRRGGMVMGAVAKTKITRSEFGITYGAAMISDEVEIEINVEAKQAKKAE